MSAIDVTKIENTVKADLTFIQKHERFLLITFALLLVLFLGSKWLDHSADVADAKYAVAQQELVLAKQSAAQSAENAKAAVEQAQSIKDSYQSLVQTLEKQNAALAASISSRNSDLKRQQASDASLSIPDLANRWKGLLALGNDVLLPSGSGVLVSEAGVRATVTALEEIPVLKSNIVDLNNVIVNKDTELNKANTVIASLGTAVNKQQEQINGLNTQIVASDNAHKKEVTKLKADARKSKVKIFFLGVLTGIGLRSSI